MRYSILFQQSKWGRKINQTSNHHKKTILTNKNQTNQLPFAKINKNPSKITHKKHQAKIYSPLSLKMTKKTNLLPWDMIRKKRTLNSTTQLRKNSREKSNSSSRESKIIKKTNKIKMISR